MLMRPHVPAARYTLNGQPRGGKVTLIGASEQKGVHLLQKLAQAMPEQEFLVVQNAYDRQRLNPGSSRNLTVLPVQADMRTVYADTRILLVLSVESWGRVIVEAAHAGIPSIAHPCPGILELGIAHYYADRSSVLDVRGLIRYLDDPDVYAYAQRVAVGTAGLVEQTTAADLDRTITRLEELTRC